MSVASLWSHAVTLWSVLCCVSATTLYFKVYPPSSSKFTTDEKVELLLSLQVDPVNPIQDNDTYVIKMNHDFRNNPSPLIVEVRPKEEYQYLNMTEKDVWFSPYDLLDASLSGHSFNKSVYVQSSLLGRYYFNFFYRTNDEDQSYPLASDYAMKFNKPTEPTDLAFTICLTIGVTLITINMGIELDIEIIKNTLKRPIGPAAGFCSQFIFMPVIAFTMAWFLLKEPLFRLGLFVIGCCPGGTISNFWTLLLYGDVSLSVTMTFISVLCAMGMMPLWLSTLGSQLITSELAADIRIPYIRLVTSLVSMTIPLGIGMLFRWKFPKYGLFISKKVAKPATWVMNVAIVSLGLYSMRYCVHFASNEILLSGAVVAFGGYLFGFTVSSLCRLSRPQIVAITMETGIQNAAICLVLMRLSFPEPEREMASVPVMSQVIFSAAPLFIIYPILMLYRLFFMKKKEKPKPLDDKLSNGKANPAYVTETHHM